MAFSSGTDIGKSAAVNAFTATGNGVPFYPAVDIRGSSGGYINWAVWGTFVGTVIVEKSFDGGTTWLPAKDISGATLSLTAPGSFQIREFERGVQYRARCSAYTSGTINSRLSQ